ncbi:hypothetical protein LSAT2_027342, partial [Lamellibrachia satsuma]
VVVVTGVRPASGSLEGGATITIDGSYFDDTDAPATVYVDGAPCEVTSVTDEMIECVVPRQPTRTFSSFAGNRGTLLESWTSTESLDVVSAYVTSAESTHTLDEWQWSDTIQDTLVSRTRAYFVPPSDNDYQFVVTADDEAMVWLSPTDDPAAKAIIITCDQSTRTATGCPVSGKMPLVAGQQYVKPLDDPTISISGWQTQTPIADTQRVEVTSAVPQYMVYRLGVSGVYTGTGLNTWSIDSA